MKKTTDYGFKKYADLPTEKINPATRNIDRISLRGILEKLNEEDGEVPLAVKKALPAIERGARLLSKTFLKGKRIFFIGAGTSGRLGVLEASELPPTYGVSKEQFVAVMAGGNQAVFLSREGAEDVYGDGFDVIKRKARKGDLVIGIAASGITPYVKGALDSAKKLKAGTIFVTCNTKENPGNADIKIAVDPGPEPINGSTRMKSGTATKLILNMLTTSAMVISGKVYRNWMVDVKRTSLKLQMRAERITAQIARVSREKAAETLARTGYGVKEAIVMARLGVGLKKASALLKKHKGFLRKVIE